MSIIYKALQKTQETISSQATQISQAKLAKRSRLIDFSLLFTIVFLFILVLFAYFPIIKTHLSFPTAWMHSTLKTQASLTLPEVDYQNDRDIMLSGIFVSNQERLAMINNQQMHVGDTVKGMKLIFIDQDKIKLLSDNVIYIIHL